MNEIKVMAEGTLSLVQASGSGGIASGNAWATASAPASAKNIAYVESFSFTSAQTVVTKSNRGRPTHHKITEKTPVTVTFNVGYTGAFTGWLTASGTTVPLVHAEWRALDADDNTTGAYYQFHGLALQSNGVTENSDGDTRALSFVGLGMNGATASGYLS